MRRVPLRRYLTMNYGDALGSDERQPGQVPVMSSGGQTGVHNQANTSGPVVVVGRKGSHGSVWWSENPAFVIDTAYSIDASTTAADLRWVYWVLQSLGLSDLSNDVGVPGLSRESAYAELVTEVGFDEQRRIADFLDDHVARIDHVIAARKSQHRTLDSLAKSELAAIAFQGTASMPLRYLIVDERLGLWGQEPDVDEVDVWVARVADFHRPEFRLSSVPTRRSAASGHVASRALFHGDVLLERSGGTKINPVGCPAFVDSPQPSTVCSNFVSRLRPTPETDGRYLSLLLGAMYSTRQQEPHSSQTTGIQNLNSESYLSTRVPDRSLEEQRRAARVMDTALASARSRQSALEASVSLLLEYKQSLITAAVTRELDVATAGNRIPR